MSRWGENRGIQKWFANVILGIEYKTLRKVIGKPLSWKRLSIHVSFFFGLRKTFIFIEPATFDPTFHLLYHLVYLIICGFAKIRIQAHRKLAICSILTLVVSLYLQNPWKLVSQDNNESTLNLLHEQTLISLKI